MKIYSVVTENQGGLQKHIIVSESRKVDVAAKLNVLLGDIISMKNVTVEYNTDSTLFALHDAIMERWGESQEGLVIMDMIIEAFEKAFGEPCHDTGAIYGKEE